MPRSAAADLNAVFRWAGVSRRDFAVKKRSDVRGLFAKKAYAEGDVVFRISTFLSEARVKSGCAAPLGAFLAASDDYATLSRNGRLACVLSLTRTPQEWRPYWRTIPMTKSALSWSVWFWPRDEVDLVRDYDVCTDPTHGYGAYHAILHEDWVRFGRVYDAYVAHFQDAPVYRPSRKRFQEKCMLRRIVVTSRGFGFGDGEIAVVPLLDLMNHGSRAAFNVSWSYVPGETPHFKAVATKSIRPGAELLDSYGHGKDPKQFAFYYGFLPSRRTRRATFVPPQVRSLKTPLLKELVLRDRRLVKKTHP